ncbi:MAG: hypothetical protein HY650_05670 [Acidobacteria bacterium]|nr:hypothetical protein [Acidobacteriota bacterium]
MTPFRLDEAIALLARTTRVLNALLSELPPGWAEKHEGADTSSPFDVSV